MQTGVKYRTISVGRFTIFGRFACPAQALKELDTQGWQSSTPGGPDI